MRCERKARRIRQAVNDARSQTYYGNYHMYDPAEFFALKRVKFTFFDRAIADVLPTPEDYWPGADIISDRKHSPGRVRGITRRYSFGSIRATPLAPVAGDELYPVVKAANQIPTHSTLLFA